MKFIPKDHFLEPESLRDFRENTPNARYKGLPGDIKQDIRAVLVMEQGFLCAYCMSRITPDNKKMEIEHYIPQNRHTDSKYTEIEHKRAELDFSNMLGTCNNVRSCSGIRKNIPISIDPRMSNCETSIKFDKNGIATSEDINIQKDIDKTLRLNELSENRRIVIDKAREEAKSLKKEWTNQLLDREIERWKSLKQTRHGRGYEPYCMAAVHYLTSKKK